MQNLQEKYENKLALADAKKLEKPRSATTVSSQINKNTLIKVQKGLIETVNLSSQNTIRNTKTTKIEGTED